MIGEVLFSEAQFCLFHEQASSEHAGKVSDFAQTFFLARPAGLKDFGLLRGCGSGLLHNMVASTECGAYKLKFLSIIHHGAQYRFLRG